MITLPSRNGLATGFVRLHQADVPVKVVKIPPAPTAGTAQRIRALQTEEIFDGRCAGDVYKLRPIKSSPRAIAECSIDREKVLQTGALMRVQAMRAVSCDAY
jgi:hypothetical protein